MCLLPWVAGSAAAGGCLARAALTPCPPPQGNKLSALPASVGRLGALVELFITDNVLAALPPELGRCSALVKLQASFNRLAALPPELGRLPRLEMLRVAVCDIAGVRPTVNFRVLYKPGNPCASCAHRRHMGFAARPCRCFQHQPMSGVEPCLPGNGEGGSAVGAGQVLLAREPCLAQGKVCCLAGRRKPRWDLPKRL